MDNRTAWRPVFRSSLLLATLTLATSSCMNWPDLGDVACGGPGTFHDEKCWNIHYVFAQNYGGTGDEEPRALRQVPGGSDLVVGGRYSGTATVGGAGLPAGGRYDLYIAKYGPKGEHQWSKGFGGGGNEDLTALAVGQDGSVYATGTFDTDPLVFGVKSTGRKGTIDGWVVRLRADGEVAWSGSMGGTGANVLPRDIAVVPNTGTARVLGGFSGTVTFGTLGTTRTVTAADQELFLTERAGDAETLVLYSSCASGGRMGGEALAMDAKENLFVAGIYSGSCQLGALSLPVPPAASALVVAKYRKGTDGALELVWHAEQLQMSASGPVRLAVDAASGDVLVATNFVGLVGTKRPLSNDGMPDVALMRLNAENGTLRWAEVAGGPGRDTVQALGIAPNDASVWVAGSFEGNKPAFAAASGLTNAGKSDIFAVHYGPDGRFGSAYAFGGTGDDAAAALVANAGSVVLAGTFQGQVGFLNDPFVAQGTDAFLSSFTP